MRKHLLRGAFLIINLEANLRITHHQISLRAREIFLSVGYKSPSMPQESALKDRGVCERLFIFLYKIIFCSHLPRMQLRHSQGVLAFAVISDEHMLSRSILIPFNCIARLSPLAVAAGRRALRAIGRRKCSSCRCNRISSLPPRSLFILTICKLCINILPYS